MEKGSSRTEPPGGHKLMFIFFKLPNTADFVGTTWYFWEALLGHAEFLEILLYTAKPDTLLSFSLPMPGMYSHKVCLMNMPL